MREFHSSKILEITSSGVQPYGETQEEVATFRLDVSDWLVETFM